MREKTPLMRIVASVLSYSLIFASCLQAAQVTAAETTAYFFSADRQGSLTGVYDSNNQALMRQSWSPWGKRMDENSQSTHQRFSGGYPMRLGYTGHKQLIDAALVLAGDTRLYDPILQRFYNTDDRTTGGVRGMNRFSYAYNNPMKYVDPDGHAPMDSDDDDEMGLIANDAIDDAFNMGFELGERTGYSRGTGASDRLVRRARRIAHSQGFAEGQLAAPGITIPMGAAPPPPPPATIMGVSRNTFIQGAAQAIGLGTAGVGILIANYQPGAGNVGGAMAGIAASTALIRNRAAFVSPPPYVSNLSLTIPRVGSLTLSGLTRNIALVIGGNYAGFIFGRFVASQFGGEDFINDGFVGASVQLVTTGIGVVTADRFFAIPAIGDIQNRRNGVTDNASAVNRWNAALVPYSLTVFGGSLVGAAIGNAAEIGFGDPHTAFIYPLVFWAVSRDIQAGAFNSGLNRTRFGAAGIILALAVYTNWLVTLR